jgi:hypothetical protein
MDVGGGRIGAVELDNPVNRWEIKSPGQGERSAVVYLAGNAADLAATSVANSTAASRLQKS